MKTLLLCPAHRPAVSRLAETDPLALTPILGKCLVEYWLEYLVARGERDVRIIALDRPDRVRARVGDGCRWGLRVEVVPQNGDPAPSETRRYYADPTSLHDGTPDSVVLMDHLPGLTQLPLFDSYEGWFNALQAWLPHTATPDRIGRRELMPGVSVGLHSRIDPSAQLHAPCWIGENVFVGANAVIGPSVILEDRAFIEPGARIAQSVIGRETFVGGFTLIEQSLACGQLLINWKTRSCLDVPDEFLLSSLGTRPAVPRALHRLKSPRLSLRDLVPEQSSWTTSLDT